MQISITMDPLKYARLQQDLADIPGAAEKAASAAINDAAKQGRTVITKSFTAQLTAKAKIIRTRVRQSERATPKKLSALLRIKGDRLGLLQFKTRYVKRRGIIAQIFKGIQQVFPNAFLGIGPKEKKHALQRTQGKRKITQAHYAPNLNRIRQNVATVAGTNLVEVVEKRPEMLDQPLVAIQEALIRRTQSQIDRFLKA